MTPETVDCDNDVTVTVTAPLVHECPFKDERDHGTVTITWRANGQTFELHALRGYLDGFASSRVSHESITDLIRHELGSVAGVQDVAVTSTWTTASFQVIVKGGGCADLLRQPIHPEG